MSFFTKNLIFSKNEEKENKNSKLAKQSRSLKILINKYKKKYETESSEKIIRKEKSLLVKNDELRKNI